MSGGVGGGGAEPDCDEPDIRSAELEWVQSTVECKGWNINNSALPTLVFDEVYMRWTAAEAATGALINYEIPNAPPGDYTITITGTRYAGEQAGAYFQARIAINGVVSSGNLVTVTTLGEIGISTLTVTVDAGDNVSLRVAVEQGQGRHEIQDVDITIPVI